MGVVETEPQLCGLGTPFTISGPQAFSENEDVGIDDPNTHIHVGVDTCVCGYIYIYIIHVCHV